MNYFLGIDVGGTKTHALVADATGRALGLGEAGCGNHEMVGYAGLGAVLERAATQALDHAGVSVSDIAGAGFGIAGFDWESEREPTLRVISSLGLRAPVQAVNDAVIGLIAGVSHGWGIAIIAGTGCNCYGRDRAGRLGRVTGMGWAMGEAGGAGDVVEEAVRQVARAWSRRGPQTALTQTLIELTGAAGEQDLLEGLCERRYSLEAGVARLVFQVARDGDPAARATIAWAGRQLADLGAGVIRQLGLEREEFEVALMGSLFEGGPLLIEPLRECLLAVAPGAQLVRPGAPPVVGAVLLGMEQVGLRDAAVRARLVETLCKLMTSDE